MKASKGSLLAGSLANFVAKLRKAMYLSVGLKIFAQTMLKVKIACIICCLASLLFSFSYWFSRISIKYSKLSLFKSLSSWVYFSSYLSYEINSIDFSFIFAISWMTSCSQSVNSYNSSFYLKKEWSSFLSIFISSSQEAFKKLSSSQLVPHLPAFASRLEPYPIELTGARKGQRSLLEPDFPSSLICTSSPCYQNILIKYVSNSFRGRNGNAHRNWRQLISEENMRLVLHLCRNSCSSICVSDVFRRRGRAKCFCRDYGAHHSQFSILWSKSIQFLLHTLLYVSFAFQLGSKVCIPWIWSSAYNSRNTCYCPWNCDRCKCSSFRLLHRRNLDFVSSITRIQSHASWTSNARTCRRRKLSTTSIIAR